MVVDLIDTRILPPNMLRNDRQDAQSNGADQRKKAMVSGVQGFFPSNLNLPVNRRYEKSH
jgi:hypothetical protein